MGRRLDVWAMTKDQKDSLIRRLFDYAFNRGNLAILEELLTPDSITHLQTSGFPNNHTGFKQLIASLRLAFPDLHCTVEDEIEEKDKLAALWTMCGTHKGSLFGNQPTSRLVEVRGFILAHTVNGRITEHWLMIDQMGMLQQLGIVPPPRGNR